VAHHRRRSSAEHFEEKDVVAEYAAFEFLLQPERAILDLLAPSLDGARVLDLGVGGGRTTAHVAHRVQEYVGLDVSHPMVEACCRRYQARLSDRFRFVQGDARDLSSFSKDSFDLVLFAWQGIDSVGQDDDRLVALREIRRVCETGGAFVFSTDNLSWARDRLSFVAAVRESLHDLRSRGNPLHLVQLRAQVAQALNRTLRLRRVNRSRALRGSHGMFTYQRPRYELSPQGFDRPNEMIDIDGYVIKPSAQIRQLEDCGFRDVRVFAPDGAEVTGSDDHMLRRWEWLYYFARAGELDDPASPDAHSGQYRRREPS
jgi:SAM-dependent methyltransferase